MINSSTQNPNPEARGLSLQTAPGLKKTPSQPARGSLMGKSMLNDQAACVV